MTRSLFSLATVILLDAMAGFAEARDPLRLPPDECIRAQRAARIAHMNGDTATELANLRRAAEEYPQEIAAIYGLLEYHRNHGLAAEEVRDLRALLVRRLEDSESRLPIGVLTWIARDPDADEATLRTVVEIVTRRLGDWPADPDLLLIMASLQLRLGLEETALETLTRLDQVRPSEFIRWRRIGLCVRLGRWGEAADTVAELMEGESGAHLRSTYIKMLGKAGRLEEQARQIESFLAETSSETLAGNPASLKVLRTVAWEMRDAGNDDEAQRHFRRILEINPEDQAARAVLVQLYGTAAERQALAAAEAERWSAEEDPNSLFAEGTQLLTAGDAEAAIDLLRRAAPEFPDLEAAWYNLGMAAYRLEEWETVASAFGRAGELNPQRAESFFFRGIALSKLEQCAEAVSALDRAVNLDPERTLAHYYLWGCYSALGDRAAAGRHRQLYEASN